LPVVLIAVVIAVAVLLCRPLRDTEVPRVFVPADVRRSIAAASVAAALSGLAIAAPPAVAEVQDYDMNGLEERLSKRDQGIRKLEAERLKPSLSPQQLERLEREELALARRVEQEQIQRTEREEQQQKDAISKKIRAEVAAIEREEAAAKAQVDKDVKAELARLEAAEKAAVKEARQIEAAEKKAALEAERRQKATAKSEEARIAAEDAREAAYLAAVDKSEKTILAASDSYAQGVKEALQKAEASRVTIRERAETLRKAAEDRAELATEDVVARAERAERSVIADEERLNLRVVTAVEEAEKEELREENEVLEKLQVVASSIANVLLPVVLPGAAMAVYAVIASFLAEEPPPCKGSESDDTRIKMGRKERAKTAPASLDPWEKSLA